MAITDMMYAAVESAKAIAGSPIDMAMANGACGCMKSPSLEVAAADTGLKTPKSVGTGQGAGQSWEVS
jgi:hypothetical protein